MTAIAFSQAKAIAILKFSLQNRRSHFQKPKRSRFESLINKMTAIALSKAKAIAILKLNQQDDGDRTFKSQSDRSFKV